MAFVDPRDSELAKVIVRHSIKAKAGELVYIDAVGLETAGLAQALCEEVTRAGAAPFVYINDPEILRKFLHLADEGVFKRLAQFELKMMQDATCYVGIRGTPNSFETSDVPRGQMDLYTKHIRIPVHLEERVKRTRWCVMRYPNSAMAQLAEKPRESFADYYYRVCTADYAAMEVACRPLKAYMEKTDRVEIKGPGTDLSFSIRNIPVIPCFGTHNIPDGECFTAPVRDSVNGTVAFNAPTIWEGSPYDKLTLKFEKGQIVAASAANAEQSERLNRVLDQDEGARYVGEFSLAFNPHVLHPMKDILFDEKIAGSFHMAMGQAYEEADNGNRSGLHWDMVCIQRPEYGGGEIYFDGKLIRKDGEFVVEELKGLNRDRLG